MPERAAEIDQIPDDQKIAGKAELPDDGQLVLELPAHLGLERVAVALARAVQRHDAQVAVHALALRHGKTRKFVAEVLERELEPLRQPARVRDGVGSIGKERAHLGRALEMPLGVGRERVARGVEMRVQARAGEDIEHLAARRVVVQHAVGGQQRQALRVGQIDQQRVQRPLLAPAMALDFDEEILLPENAAQAIELLLGRRAPARGKMPAQRALLVAGERDQALGKLGQFLPGDARLVFGRAQPGARDQPAEILVAGARGHQHGEGAAVGHGQLAADQRAHALLARGGEEARRAGHAVAIAQRHGGQPERGGAIDQRLRAGGPAQKAEGAPRVELDVIRIGGHGGSLSGRDDRPRSSQTGGQC